MLAISNSCTKSVLNSLLLFILFLFVNNEHEAIQIVSNTISLCVSLWREEQLLLFFSVSLKHFTATKEMFQIHKQLMIDGLKSQQVRVCYLALKCWIRCSVEFEHVAERSSGLFLMALKKESDDKIRRIIYLALFDCVLAFKLVASDRLFNVLSEGFWCA
jgi:hypothetical protein